MGKYTNIEENALTVKDSTLLIGIFIVTKF
jgi:hypothetical protein